MSKREYILRYLSIIKKMRTSKTASFEDINSFLERESEMTGFNLVISKRTFQRDLDEIRSLFNVDIQFDFSQKYYFIEMEEDQTEVYNRMLEAFDLFNSLNMASGIQPYVFFDKRKALGTEHFYGLLHAIKKCISLEIQYQKFYEDKADHKNIEPYALKESHHRWYLVAKDKKDNVIKTFGLDRISDVVFTGPRFKYPKDLDIAEMYKNSFGIITKNTKPEHIVLQCNKEEGRYIKSFPFHESQKIIESGNDFIIELDLHLTQDFILELMKLCGRVEVLKPAGLRKTIKEMLRESLKIYSS